jgi:transcriptional regulator with XRE-family HTH domain
MRDLEYLTPKQCRILQEALVKNGLYQKDLAKEIGITPGHLSRVARGLAECPPEMRKDIERELGLEVNSLSPDNSFQPQEQNSQTTVKALQNLDQKLQIITELLQSQQQMLTVYAKHTTERLNDLEEFMKPRYPSEERPLKNKSTNKLSYTRKELVERLPPNEKLLLTEFLVQRFKELTGHSDIEKWTCKSQWHRESARKPIISLSDMQRLKVLPIRSGYGKFRAARFSATPEQ